MRCVSVPDSESLKFEIVTEYLQIRERVIAKLGTGTGHWAQVESSRVTAGRDLRSSDWIWRSDVHLCAYLLTTSSFGVADVRRCSVTKTLLK